MQLIPSVSSPVVTIHIPAKQPVIHRRTQKISAAHICYIEKAVILFGNFIAIIIHK